MNKRFLRWVLDVTHRTERQYTRFGKNSLFYGQNYFTWVEPAIRWNGLMCSAFSSMIFLVMLFADSDKLPVPSKIGLGGCIVYLWFISMNAWFFHMMRRKKMFSCARLKKVRMRTRWMLNATPCCFVGTFLFSVLLLVPSFPLDAPREIVLFYFVFIPMIPYFTTRFWIMIATTPFHTGYGSCKPRN